MRIAAHRGLHTTFPENSLAAFEAAVRAGADAIELDVRLSRDGVPMVTHDVECRRSLGLGWHVFEHDAGELAARPLVGSPPDAPLYIPRLDEVLDTFAGGIGVEIELKDPMPELGPAVARSLEPHRAHWPSVEVTSFEPASLLVLSRALPAQIATCLLLAPPEPWVTPRILAHLAAGKARLAGAGAVHLHSSQLDPEALASLRAGGVEVHAWGVNDEEAFVRATRAGVTHCDTDEVERMLALRGARTS
ncbi:MAG: glycerophosphodiester phosphodiesterase [Candidatus Limnocylindria bacterium]